MTQMTQIPDQLRAELAAEYRPVRPLASPVARMLWLLPLAALAVAAAPTVFNVRADAARLGWLGWGASGLQVLIGLALVVAALQESVPGRGWKGRDAALWIVTPLAVVLFVTLNTWAASPGLVRGGWWFVGLLCLGGSLAAGLPIVALASVLAARAYPTRPALAGALLGLGAGLIADAGWRLFCDFSEPAHVLSAHVGAVLSLMLLGSLLAPIICPARRRS
ncbi:MAG: NrsF family protein [Vicinamibacterales bacterium]